MAKYLTSFFDQKGRNGPYEWRFEESPSTDQIFLVVQRHEDPWIITIRKGISRATMLSVAQESDGITRLVVEALREISNKFARLEDEKPELLRIGEA